MGFFMETTYCICDNSLPHISRTAKQSPRTFVLCSASLVSQPELWLLLCRWWDCLHTTSPVKWFCEQGYNNCPGLDSSAADTPQRTAWSLLYPHQGTYYNTVLLSLAYAFPFPNQIDNVNLVWKGEGIIDIDSRSTSSVLANGYRRVFIGK